ncbi:prostaglandin F2-alpha receptor-like [Liolophura sinensis]|uniref:prostaglandin F2-alpha receptor-like n=1 Tax=Liolophura sinensis TaxID=3198878 RepID=UPI003158B963
MQRLVDPYQYNRSCGGNLLAFVMNCIPQVVNYWAGYCAAGGLATCLYLGYMQTFFLKSSHAIVVLMALERAVAIVSPFRHPRMWTTMSTLVAMAVVFVYSNIIAALPFFGINKYGYRSFCWFTWDDPSPLGRAYVYYYVTEGFILTSVMVVCNIAVIRELLRMRYARERMGRSSLVKPEFIALMISISVLFIICTTPLMIRMLSVQMGFGLSAEWDFLAMRFFITNSAINSHLYWVLRIVVGKNLLTRAMAALRSLIRRGSAIVTPVVESEVGVEKSATTAIPQVRNDSVF